MAARRCLSCGIERPPGEFVPSRPSMCRKCGAKRGREYRANFTPEQRQRDLDGMAAWGLNLKRHDIEQQRVKQGGLCAICHVLLTRGRAGSGQTVDHDHETYKPRGLLCRECNRRVSWYEGMQRFDPAYRASLLAYLANPPWTFVGEVDVDLIRERLRHRTGAHRRKEAPQA